MRIENIMEYSEQDMMAESLIESNLDFKTFCALPLMAKLSKNDAMVIFSCMNKVTFDAGENVYQAGEVASRKMTLILEGKVGVTNESGYKFNSLKSGDVFGLFSFLDETRPHSVTLSVEKDTTALVLERTLFDLIALEEPKLAHKLMRFMFGLLSKKASELEVEYAHMHNFAFGGKV